MKIKNVSCEFYTKPFIRYLQYCKMLIYYMIPVALELLSFKPETSNNNRIARTVKKK